MSKHNKKFVIITLVVVLALAVVFVAAFGYLWLKVSSDNIYPSVSVGTLKIGGMNITSAEEALAQRYPTEDVNVRVECEGVVFDIQGSDYALKADYRATAEKAASLGKDGDPFSKMLSYIKFYFKPQTVDLVISCDYDTLQYYINEKLGALIEDVQQYSVVIGENELVITNGKSGRVAEVQELLNLISKAVVEDKLSEVIKLGIQAKDPEKIDVDKFIEEYNREPEDATVSTKGDIINITPEVVGIKIDEAKAREILEKNKNNTQSYTIPAEITYPAITAAQLEAEYTDTIIGSFSTNYSTSSLNRKTNIHLASDKINGLTLNPGEVFSFNNVVGPRNAANGYKIAQVYSGGKSVDGIGGGICQVSSTLYNAVVFADLEIVSRNNHTLPVSYVPLGRDATVSYGTIDFKFKNNKESPIKLEIVHDGSTLSVNIYGRKKYIKDISIETAITGSIPYTTTEIKDDTMFEGETKVEEAGANGTKVESYKVIKENGEIVSRTLLAKSSYTSTPKVVRIGTKKKESIPAVTEPLPEPPPIEEIPPEPTEPVPETPNEPEMLVSSGEE